MENLAYIERTFEDFKVGRTYMDDLFGFTPSGIEAQYKQDKYIKEAREYRLIRQIDLENKKRKLQNCSKWSNYVSRLRIRRNQVPEGVLFLGKPKISRY